EATQIGLQYVRHRKIGSRLNCELNLGDRIATINIECRHRVIKVIAGFLRGTKQDIALLIVNHGCKSSQRDGVRLLKRCCSDMATNRSGDISCNYAAPRFECKSRD